MASTSELVQLFEAWFESLKLGEVDKSRVRAIKQAMLKVLTDNANLGHFEKITKAASDLNWKLDVYVAAMGSSGMPEADAILKMVDDLDSEDVVQEVLVPMNVGNVVVDRPVGTDTASKPVPGPIQLTMFDKGKDAAPGTAMDGAGFTTPPAAKPLMDRTGVAKDMAADVEITEEEPKGIKAGLKRITSWLPGGKENKKESKDEAEVKEEAEKLPVTPNPRPTYGPSKGTAAAPKTSYTARTQSASKNERYGKVAGWAVGILFLVLLVISAVIYFKFGGGDVNSDAGGYSNSLTNEIVSAEFESCTTADQGTGIILYTLAPAANIVQDDVVLETTKSYLAIRYGSDYVVAANQSDVKILPANLFVPGTATECVSIQSVKVLTDAVNHQNDSVSVQQLAYKIDTSHWSGWLVIATMIAVVGAALLSLFMTGSKLVNIVFFVVAVFTVMFDSATTITAKWPEVHFFLVFLGGYIFCVMAGGKEELQEQKESFDAGNQLKLPEAMKSLFESLSRMFGIAGRFDWTYSGIYATIVAAAGAVVLFASPLFRVFEDRTTALLVASLFIVLSFMMEAWRRGLPGDWWTFGVGFIGLLDFAVYYAAFNVGIQISDFSSTAVAIFGWLITLLLILGIDFGIQAANSRTELQRDRLADGALFGAAMKLIAILAYVFVYVMAGF